MRTACRRELIFQNAHRAQARAQFSRPKMVLITSQVRKMSTALRREHQSQHKCAPCAHVPGAPVGGATGDKYIFPLDTYVRRTPPRRESHGGAQVL